MSQMDIIANILGTKSKPRTFTRKGTKNSNRHVWTAEEEISVINLYKTNPTASEVEGFAKNSVLKVASIKMKLENIRFVDTGIGLENVSSLTRRLWDEQNVK